MPYDLKDSNVENIGSEMDKAARHAAAMKEVEWDGAGSEPGLEIWRVCNTRTQGDAPEFGIKREDKERWGSFFRGDSYIVLRTSKVQGGDALEWALHFWIGSESSADEYGVAAYKSVELDDMLGGGPVQHREIEGFESKLFLSYFSDKGPCPGGVRYLEGGYASGFRHVAEVSEYKPRLLHVRREAGATLARQVELSVASLNAGDSFILDSGNKLFVYRGEESDGFEKMKAQEMAKTMESERHGKSKVVDAFDDDEFWKVLGCEPGTEVGGAIPRDAPRDLPLGGEAEVAELYSMDDATREFVKVCDGPLSKEQLRDDDVMLVSTPKRVFVVVGPAAPVAEKASGMFKAQQFLSNKKLDARTPITRVVAGFGAGSMPEWEACFG
mmetsp:Transcript_15686/g.39427  ORF Transcript_15686/g.39427 Transcript_15686/m.39427 type:complete len:384 (+) Transcript_15686:38-1189(+)|eukprot:CAMPEP_0173440182 /NCGR_PEP_ID=MMETSP1357-20121228/22366_1 /TAXON_ID=77926 /ORGANISM="Hemiselmis rufescens, Strain PCC563" /LENGTH=383 /DNA_ID=CAMNT_0014405643 /DNA_START=36 /DNA_END=1187 /DNA_ORIENTATION=+